MATKQKGRPKKNPVVAAPQESIEETIEIKKVSNPVVEPKPDNPLVRDEGGIREFLVIRDGRECY